ncbi:MFS transporter [Natrarchaeobaculum sulfurireducens]|uniref:Fosmidomycin resistance protein n=1 Tax=Natrarchaeobaculum sulfurireducens TaxID=2044521 RepID=A0A346PJA3_9EURY|nr:MFS transporter [Natrarchaeobaculum sulfurireducens]AXR79598.1 MFS family permease [Natrarchaeobaculum sulfurireducens]AXR83371.1 Fosmidomycin resistance protein [Natrarchaeobaculum sulfurireducens]
MTSKQQAGARTWLRRDETGTIVAAVSVAHFLSHVYLLAYPPLFPLIGAEFGLTTTQLGLLVTAIYVPTLLLQIPIGEVVDRIGAKRILVAGLVVTSLGVALSGLAPTYGALLAFALVSGVGQSVFHPADYALLESVTDATNQGSAFGLHTFGGFAGFAAAPILTGTLGIQFGWRVALPAVGALGIAYAVVLLVATKPVYRRQIRTRKEPEVSATSDAEPGVASSLRGLFRTELLVVSGFYLVSMMAIVALQSFTTVFAIESFGFSDSAANTVLTAYLVGTAVGVIAGGPFADRAPFQYVIVGAFGLAAVGIWVTVVAIHGSYLTALAVFGVVGLLIGMALPSRDKLANSFADEGSTGKSFGFFFTGLSLGAVISPAVVGAIIDASSATAAFLVVSGILLVGAAIVVGLALYARGRS